MSSEKQVAANRQNALHSTGPRTAAGKAKVAENALTHGLTAQQVLVPGENAEEFETFRVGIFDTLAPRGLLEGWYAEQVVIAAWRLRRVPIFEAAFYRRGSQEVIVKRASDACREYELF
jgi:hypothetical protein